MDNSLVGIDSNFIHDLRIIIQECRQRAYFAINSAQVTMNWMIGRRIVEQEQSGAERAEYGKYVIRLASERLTEEFGRGFSISNLKSFRKFYIEYKELAVGQILTIQSSESKGQTLSALLPWSHYERLMRITDREARAWYENEAQKEMWSYRTLDRNISTQFYERMLLSQIKEDVKTEMTTKNLSNQKEMFAYIKNPTVLEFLGLPANSGFTESELEKAILNNIEGVLMEMGKGFALVARQRLIRTEARDYFIDLVFYNYITKCFF